MKKIIILILLIAAFVVVGGFYINKRMPKNLLLPSVEPKVAVELPIANKGGEKIDFKNYGKVPEFTGIDHWLNSEPLTAANLKDKVVLIDFWTFSCINCIRTLPYVTKWYDTYHKNGLVVVGVHTPEFAFEKDTDKVADAIKRFGIHYPVAQDNEYATWNAYNNQYWPAEYLINQKGEIVYVHFGEGNYDRTENAIRTLLGVGSVVQNNQGQENIGEVGSPEMYFGTNRLKYLDPRQKVLPSSAVYSFPQDLLLNNFALEGSWQFTPEDITLLKSGGKIKLKFHAGKIHMVASSPNSAKLTIMVDGKNQPLVNVKESRLYSLFDSNDYVDHTIEIIIDQTGFKAFTFTFG